MKRRVKTETYEGPDRRSPFLPLLMVVILVALAGTLTAAMVIVLHQHDLIADNHAAIVQLADQQASIDRQEAMACQRANREHAIIRNALIASLTEPDVQANGPQRKAYERIVDRFAEPRKC